MLNSHLIASGGGDIFPVIIIIVAIIAQIIKAAKGTKPTIKPPDLSQGEGGYTAAEDELKKFLESLSGNTSSADTVQPPPLPLPVSRSQASMVRPVPQPRQVIDTRQQQETIRQTPRRDVTVTERSTIQAAPPPVPSAAMLTTPAAPAIHIYRKPHLLHETIVREIRTKASVRKAILLREIIGPCIALRRPGNLPSGI